MKPFLIICFFILFAATGGFGQDVHFSQATSNNLIFNPANTGNFYGSWRFSHSFRTQWKAIGPAYNTISFSFDKAIMLGNSKFYGGIYLLDDKSGVIGLHKTGLLISGAGQFYIRSGILRLGLQAGGFNLGYNLNGATVPSQYNHEIGGFDPTLSYNEPNINETNTYAVINAGLVYKTLIGKYNTEFGAALFHINRPDISFIDYEALDMAFKTHFILKFNLIEKFALEPMVFYNHMSKANNLLIGSNLEIDVPQNKHRLHTLYTGVFIRTGISRNTDALIASIGAKLFQFRIGLSYDINISELQEATYNRGAFEVSLVYTSMGRKINPATVPCFRQ